MTENVPSSTSPLTAIAGRDRIRRLSEGAKTLGVLRAAIDAGLIGQLSSPRSFDELHHAVPTVGEVSLKRALDVLVATGMLECDSDLFSMPTDIAALADDLIGIDLDAVVSETLLEVQRAPHVLGGARLDARVAAAPRPNVGLSQNLRRFAASCCPARSTRRSLVGRQRAGVGIRPRWRYRAQPDTAAKRRRDVQK